MGTVLLLLLKMKNFLAFFVFVLVITTVLGHGSHGHSKEKHKHHGKGSKEKDEVTKWWPKYLPDQQNCGLSATPPNLKSTRVAGGKEAVPGSWPWSVQIVLNDFHGCAGTIISKDLVLTAAHCFMNGVLVKYGIACGYFSVVVGRHATFSYNDTLGQGQQQITIKNIFIHPKYDIATYQNDIAILQLESPLQLNSVVRPICLPSPKLRDFKPSDVCVGIGWGRTESTSSNVDPGNKNIDPVVKWLTKEGRFPGNVLSESLNQVVLPLVGKKICRKINFDGIRTDTKKMVCAGTMGKDTCEGDSGGPLACRSANTKKNSKQRWVAYGITSFGDQSCSGNVGVYTRIYNYADWIKNVARGRATPSNGECPTRDELSLEE